MIIKFFSKTSNLIAINNTEYSVCPEIAQTEISSNFYLKVYPIASHTNKVLLPFVAHFKIKDNKLDCNNPYVFVLNYPDFAEVEILTFEIPRPNSQNLINNFSFEHNGSNYEISVFSNCENNFVVKCMTVIFQETLPNIKECSFFKMSNYVVLTYATNSNNILIFDINKNIIILNNKVLQYEIDSISNRISFVVALNDSQNHGLVKKINLSTSFDVEDEFLTYLSNEECFNNQFDEFVFFDCIKAKNFKKARSFLTKDLASIIDDDALVAYFNDFKDISQGSKENQFFLIPKAKNSTVNVFEFEKVDNLINNIKILYK